MNQLQRLKMTLIAYVNSVKAIWSEVVAHPLTIVSKLKRNVKDYKIHGDTVYGKNILDVSKYYGKWANDNGGIDIPKSATLYELYVAQSITGVFKENTQYTFSCKYNIDEATTTYLSVRFNYTDGTRNSLSFGASYLMGEGSVSLTSAAGKTVQSFNFTYGTTSRVFKGELTEMMINEGATAEEYEPCNPQYTGDIVTEGDNVGKYHLSVTVRGKNILDMSKYPARQGYYTDTGGGLSTGSTNLTAISPVTVEPNTQYTITSNIALRHVWFSSGASLGGAGVISRTFERIFTTPENCKYILISLNAPFSNFKWAMLEKGEGDGVYEPYIEPQTVDIYLDSPLDVDKVIQKSVDKLPSLPQFKGTTIYEVQTEVEPSGMEVQYYE